MPPVATAGIPDAVYRWYNSSYPTLSFNPDWLQACVDYLLEFDPIAKASVPGLIKAIEVQLLSSDLATSVIPPSTDGSFLQVNQPDPHGRQKRRVLLFRAPESATKKAGVLVQVVQVDDVAHSALSLKETLEEKKEARKLAAKGGRHSGGDGGGGGRIMDLNDADDDQDGLDAEAKRRALRLGGGKGGGEPRFPRGSGRFVLTDGGPAQWTAFELQRIAGLGLEGELKLGTKLLLRDVPCINGILMLTPQNTTVKGFQVEELDSVREWYFENAFRSRLGLEALPDPRGGGAPEIIEPPPAAAAAAAAAAPRPPPRSNNNNAHRPPPQPPRQPKQQQQKTAADDEEEDYFGDDLDLDLADFEMADQLAREASATAAAAARGLKANDRMDHDGDDDEEEEEEEEALREMRRLKAAANFRPGPTPSPQHKPPPPPPPPPPLQLKSEKSSSNSSATVPSGRLGGGDGGRPTMMAVKSSGGVISGGVEVLDLDDDDDDDELEVEVEVGSGKRREEAAEDIKPVRKKVKSEPVQAGRRREDGPPKRGTRRTVIEIEDSD